MTNQEILTKAIQKAIDGGWKPYLGILEPKSILGFYSFRGNTLYELFIFNHDFAKALWGEMKWKSIGTPHIADKESGWQYHLQQMVIVEDPIQYLGKNI